MPLPFFCLTLTCLLIKSPHLLSCAVGLSIFLQDLFLVLFSVVPPEANIQDSLATVRKLRCFEGNYRLTRIVLHDFKVPTVSEVARIAMNSVRWGSVKLVTIASEKAC